MELQNLSVHAQLEYHYSNLFYMYQWINPTKLDYSEFSNKDTERVLICQKFNELHRSGRRIYFLTTTYFPSKDYEHTSTGVDDIFKNFYTRKFLPWIHNTRRFNTSENKEIQPITYTFRENHTPKKIVRKSPSDSFGDLYQIYEFPLKMHHHSVLAVHKEHVARLTPYLGENTFAHPKFSHRIMTSSLKEADLGAVLYSSKHWSSDREMMTFPDKLSSEKSKIWKPNDFRLQHDEYHPIRLPNGQLYRI
jgi:hypothetical protein